MPEDTDLKAAVDVYLRAFSARDLDTCMSFFADDANLDFQLGVFRGREAIADWHRARWAANLRVLKIESVTVRGERVIVDLLVASDRLLAWKLPSLAGRATLTFDGPVVTHAKFAPRMMSPVDRIRSSS